MPAIGECGSDGMAGVNVMTPSIIAAGNRQAPQPRAIASRFTSLY
jgi:hypothetical protein